MVNKGYKSQNWLPPFLALAKILLTIVVSLKKLNSSELPEIDHIFHAWTFLCSVYFLTLTNSICKFSILLRSASNPSKSLVNPTLAKSPKDGITFYRFSANCGRTLPFFPDRFSFFTNVLICFDCCLYNMKHFTFSIAPLTNICKSVFLTFSEIYSFPSFLVSSPFRSAPIIAYLSNRIYASGKVPATNLWIIICFTSFGWRMVLSKWKSMKSFSII